MNTKKLFESLFENNQFIKLMCPSSMDRTFPIHIILSNNESDSNDIFGKLNIVPQQLYEANCVLDH